MTITSTTARKAQAVRGSFKKAAGRLTGRRRAQGRADQFKNNVRQAGTKIKDALKR